MKRVLATGVVFVLSLGILILVLKLVFSFLISIFRPFILYCFKNDHLVIPLTILFTFMIILIFGLIFSRIDIGRIFRGMPNFVKSMPGALVELNSGTYFIAAIIKKVKLEKEGSYTEMYVLYTPSTPIPWTGLPIIVAEKEKVIILNISFGEVYGIASSFGRITPDLLNKLKISTLNT